MNNKITNYHDQFATEYDKQAKEFEWFGGEIIFGLMYEYVKKGDKLLDIGIGTGLSSQLFYKAGLEIYGIDSSKNMLEVCREKGIAKELKNFDITKNEFPFENYYFNHVISCGVFHFFRDLEHFFDESYRVLKKDGTFCLTIGDTKNEKIDIEEMTVEETGNTIYKHGQDYILGIVEKLDFKLLKKLKFCGLDDQRKEFYLIAYVLKK